MEKVIEKKEERVFWFVNEVSIRCSEKGEFYICLELKNKDKRCNAMLRKDILGKIMKLAKVLENEKKY